MNQKQTLFVLQILSILDDSLNLNRHLIETNQIGPMSEEDYCKAMETLARIEQKFARVKANPGE